MVFILFKKSNLNIKKIRLNWSYFSIRLFGHSGSSYSHVMHSVLLNEETSPNPPINPKTLEKIPIFSPPFYSFIKHKNV